MEKIVKSRIKQAKQHGNAAHITMSKKDIGKEFLVSEFGGETEKVNIEKLLGKEAVDKLKRRINEFVSRTPGSSQTALNQQMVKDIDLNSPTLADLRYLQPLMGKRARKIIENH